LKNALLFSPKTIQDHYRKAIFSHFLILSLLVLLYKTFALSMKFKNKKLLNQLSEILNDLAGESRDT